MAEKSNKNGNGKEVTPKRSILDRLNLDPISRPEEKKATAKEKRGKRQDYAEQIEEFRGEKGHFGKGMPGGPGRPPGLYSLRKMIQEKGQVIVEQDEKKRTFAQLMVDRLWMNAVAGSERAISMVVESVDGPLIPPEPPQKPIEVYRVTFEGTTIINRRDHEREDELIESGQFIDVPGQIIEKD